jgi:hypothetical protein
MILNPPFNLLMECGSCGVENLIPGFTPGMPVICSQCRENLLALDFTKTHQGHICDSCGMALLIKKETHFSDGQSECQCGGQDYTEMSTEDFANTVSKAPDMELDDLDDDLDWCRPASDSSSPEDYNEIFDDDPGF